jgi:protein ImuB
MPRFACLLVPRFAVAAQLRAEPELRGCPLVVCDAGSRAQVVDASPEALRVGAHPGLTVAQALIRHADLVVRPLDVDALEAARAALVDVGRSASPCVELVGEALQDGAPRRNGATRYARGGEHRLASAASIAHEARQGSTGAAAARLPGAPHGGEIVIDALGLDRLFGSPAGIAAALLQRAERVGFGAGAGVGLADRRATARIAAGIAVRRGEAVLVPSGEDAAWLAPLPLDALEHALDATDDGDGRRGFRAAVERLARLGIVRCGEFAAMPIDEVASRLGPASARMWYVAAGRDRSPLRPSVAPPECSEGTRLEYGVSSIEALLFVVRGLLDRVVSRLAVLGLSCGGLTVSLGLEDGSRADRGVGVLAATRDVKTLTMLVRSAIEASPPHAAIESVHVTAIPDRPRADQLDLFRPAGPPPEQLATTLARLAALCGSGRVGRATPPPGHRPDAFVVLPFAPHDRRPPAASTTDGEQGPALALRAIRPPRAAQVFLEAGSIAYVRAPGLGGRAVVTSGPWRIDAEWWSERPCRRDYYDVQLSDGGVYRLFRDLSATGADASWYVDGCYD